MNFRLAGFLGIVLGFIPNAAFAVTYYTVSGYQGRTQNPFLNNNSMDVVYLQDFEAQQPTLSNILTTPHATAWNGGTNGTSWGVAEDYAGQTEGGNGNGWTWSFNVANPDWKKNPPGLLFEFTPDEFGRYPEYVGAALMGYNDFENVGGLFNSIFVYDRNGNEITGGDWKLPRLHDTGVGDVFTDFEGIYVPGGISKIQFRDFTDVDHLTYGYAPLPEPSIASLAGLAASSLFWRRFRRGSSGCSKAAE